MMARTEPIATRFAYGETLVELGHEYPRLVVLEADISKSTQTQHFAKAHHGCCLTSLLPGLFARWPLPHLAAIASAGLGS